jgi:gluconolactonase
MRVVAEGLEFPEGPVVLADGTVLVVELKGGTIARIDPSDGTVERVAHPGASPNGAALGPDGKLYVCNSGGLTWHKQGGLDVPSPEPFDAAGKIQVVDLDTGDVSDLYTHCGDNRLSGPNDIVFDAEGGFYFTDNGRVRGRTVDYGALHYAKADGSEIVEVVFPMEHPNGVGLSPTGDRLYVAETMTSRIWAFTIQAPGEVKESGGFFATASALLYTAINLQLFDSLAIEAGGNVCVATLMSAGVTVVSPDGELVEFVSVPAEDPMITNIAFGGADLRTAYICSSGRGRLYETEWARPGLTLRNG